MDDERERGILSKSDRRFLTDVPEEDVKSPQGRVTRSRIRERLYNALLDFNLAYDELETRDRKTLFEDYSDDRDLQRGVTAALMFLYQAIEEQGEEFEEVLTPAIERAEQRVTQDDVGDDVNIEVDVDFTVETKLVISDPDPEKYSQEEIGQMLADGRIDGKDALGLLQAQVNEE
jgi:hypothetical protein